MATAKNIRVSKNVKEKTAIRKTETKKVIVKAEIKKVETVKTAVLKFDRKELEAALSIARDFTEKRATMPILTHVHIATEKTGCRITATDLEKSWTKLIPSKGDTVNKCIPLDILIREVKALHSDIKEVELKFNEKTVKVNGRCEIFILPGADFPKRNDIHGIETDIPGLPGKIRKLLPAAGDGDTRYMLNSILIDLEKGFMVATDGHRMHLERAPAVKDGKKIVL